MGRSTAVFLGLLLGTNAAWSVHALRKGAERTELRERVKALEAQAATQLVTERRADLAGRGGPEGLAAPGVPAPTPAAPTPEQLEAWRRAKEEQQELARKAQEKADAFRLAREAVDRSKADVLQIEEPARRETGLAAIEGHVRSREPAVAAAAMRALHQLRDVTYEKARFGPAVRSRLDDEDAQVRSAAAHALLTVGADEADLDRLLDVLEAHPEDDGSLIAAAWLAKNRVDGRLADLYVRALALPDARNANNTANQLRGMWVREDVENAVLAVWRGEGGVQGSGWWHILGQIRPTRVARVRAIFEVLKKDDNSAPQLLDRALEPENLEGAAAPLAADLAAQGLPTAPNLLIRRLLLRVLKQSGTAAHASVLEAYAGNEMVAEGLRKEAAAIAADLARRR